MPQRPTSPFVCFSGIAPTIGDTAIGQSILQGLRVHTDLPVHVHTNRPDVFSALPGVDDVRWKLPVVPPPSLRSPTFALKLRAVLQDLRRTGGAHVLPPPAYTALREALHGCAAVVFQGGPSWNDRMMNARKALERWLFVEAAAHYGARVYHVGVSCGPFDWPYPRRLWMQWLCRNALDRHDLLLVRDAFSRPALQRIGVTTRVVESTDAAVFLRSCSDPEFAHVEERISVATGRQRLVVCVRDYQRSYPEAVRARHRVLPALAKVLDTVQAELADVFFLSTDHNPHDGKETDVAIAQAVQRMMTVPGTTLIDTDVRNPAALKHIYGRFDAMVSMRLHPTILALDHGVPCLLLSYDGKCQDFFSRLDLQEFAVPLEQFDVAPAIRQVRQMLRDATLRRRITSRYGQLKAAHANDYAAMYEEIKLRGESGGWTQESQHPQPPAGCDALFVRADR